MSAVWADAADRVLARSLFGTDDRTAAEAAILAWAARHDLTPGHLETIVLGVGAVATVRQAGGARIVVKLWPAVADPAALAAQIALQSAMASRGYPAPAPLTELTALGLGWAVAMTHDRPGEPTDARLPGVRRVMAAGLARFLAEAQAARGALALPAWRPPPEPELWPPPHNALFDLAGTGRGAEWIDELARPALAVMRSAAGPLVPGHRDWSAKNMRLGGHGIAVLYDWDAVFLDRETLLAGMAAATFAVSWELGEPVIPKAAEVAGFVRDYEAARGTPFTMAELGEVAAAATYIRAYTARCEHALDGMGARRRGSFRELLRHEQALALDRHHDD